MLFILVQRNFHCLHEHDYCLPTATAGCYTECDSQGKDSEKSQGNFLKNLYKCLKLKYLLP